MKDSLPVVLAAAGALLAYVSAPSQRWLRVPAPAWPTRGAAAACIVAALAFGARTVHPASACALVITVVMACLTLSPFVGVCVERLRAGAARHGA